MKNFTYLLCYFCFNIIANAQDIIKNKEPSDYGNIDFEVDFDFFGENKIINVFSDTADIGWKLIGADSHSFVQVKEIIKDSQRRTELVLAILTIEKYPLEANPYKGINNLLSEMKWAQLFDCFDDCEEIILSIRNSTKFQKIYMILRKLQKIQRFAIIEFLVNQNHFIIIENAPAEMFNSIKSLEDSIKRMLEEIIDEYSI